MLSAGQDATLHHVKVISIVSLFDDYLSWLLLHILHCVQYYLELLRVEAREHECLLQSLLESILDLWVLGI